MRSWLQETVGGLPRTFWYLWSGNLINRAGGFVGIMLAIYLSDYRGFDASFVGLVVGMVGGGGAIGALIGGQLADRWGRRSTLLTAQVGTAATMLLLGFSSHPWLILGTCLLLGTVQSMARPAYGAMMIDVVPDQDRVRAFTLQHWVNNLAFSLAAVMAGLLAEVNFLIVFMVNAGATLIAASIIFLKTVETRPVAVNRHAGDKPVAAQSPWRDPVFLMLSAVMFLTMMIFMQHVASLPLSMTEDGFSAAAFGMVIAVNSVMIMCGQLFMPKFIKGRDRSRVLAVAAVVVGAGFGLTGFADVIWFYALTVAVWTIGEMLQSPASATLTAELSPINSRGRYQSVSSLVIAGSAFLSPIIGGLVISYLGSGVLWAGCFVLGLVVAVLHLATGPSRERRIAQLRATAEQSKPAATEQARA